eukprot:3425322-Ditylum_brightwellii.AAC.1
MKLDWQPDSTVILTHIDSTDSLITITTRQYQSILVNPKSNPVMFGDYINTCGDSETQLFRDGSVDKYMAFGWKMVTNMEETLLECSGTAHATASSFRAEVHKALLV